VQPLSGGRVTFRADVDYSWFRPTWTFAGVAELPPQSPYANVLRVTPSAGRSRHVTTPVAYRTSSLDDVLREARDPFLITPPLVTFMRCARVPAVARGIGEPLTGVIDKVGDFWTLPTATSPFAGMIDLAASVRYFLPGFPTISALAFVNDPSQDRRLEPVESS
jgi:hypothetical protein